MANTRSALKRWRQSLKRRLRNRSILSTTRTAVRGARENVAAAGAEATGDVTAAVSRLDRAVTKGVIHRNAAARKKSRLMRRLTAALAGTTPIPEPAPEPAVTPEAVMAEAKPRARRTRAAAPQAPAVVEVPAEPAAEKPKRTRRKKTEEKTEE